MLKADKGGLSPFRLKKHDVQHERDVLLSFDSMHQHQRNNSSEPYSAVVISVTL
jgi:hypothetical protein